MEAEDRRREGIADASAWRLARDRWAALRPPVPAWVQCVARSRGAPRRRRPGRGGGRASCRVRDGHGARRPAAPRGDKIAGQARADRPRHEARFRRVRRPVRPHPARTRGARVGRAGPHNRQIADELFISENTAGVHVSNILGKLGVAGRTEAAAIAVRPPRPTTRSASPGANARCSSWSRRAARTARSPTSCS